VDVFLRVEISFYFSGMHDSMIDRVMFARGSVPFVLHFVGLVCECS
jgi:hypothetical protein